MMYSSASLGNSLALASQLRAIMILQPKPNRYFLHFILFSVGVLALYGTTIPNWFNTLMGTGEDAMKNYFTLVYHVQHGGSFFWFTGMNYPYGEHLTYTDNQPLLALVLKTLNQIIPLAQSLPWLLPTCLILSFQIGSFYLFKSLEKLNVSTTPALLASIGIMLLSPQWARLGGHYALAHGFIIPLLIYLLISARSLKNSTAIITLLFLSGFIHPYFLVMGTLFTGLFLMLETLANKDRLNWKTWLIRALTTIIPIILFQLVMLVTDPVTDRPSAPFGYLFFRATLPSIVLPLYADYAIHVMRLFPGWTEYSNEGFFYIGASAILGTVVGIILWFFKNNGKMFLAWLNGHKLWLLLFSSIPVMMLSIGAPFIYEDFSSLLDHSGPLRQFRGIARFAFVFYYAVNIFAFGIVASSIKNTKFQKTGLALLILVLMIELIPYSSYIKSQTTSKFQVESEPISLDFSAFDAIFPMPYFHVGSEQFGTQNTSEIAAATMRLSLQTGLPIAAVQMSRTSLQQTVELLQLSAEQLTLHPFATSKKEEKWLIIVAPDMTANPSNIAILDKAKHIGAFSEYDLYSFSPASLREIHDEAVNRCMQVKNAPIISGDIDSLGVHFKSFDEIATETKFHGSGAMSFNRKDWFPIIEKGTFLKENESYELSFWIKYNQDHAVNTQVWFWERLNDNDLQFEVSEVAHHVSGFLGDWALCTYIITPTSPESTFEILLHRDEEMIVWVDEVLLRPLTLDVRTDSPYNLNNRYYKPIPENAVD